MDTVWFCTFIKWLYRGCSHLFSIHLSTILEKNFVWPRIQGTYLKTVAKTWTYRDHDCEHSSLECSDKYIFIIYKWFILRYFSKSHTNNLWNVHTYSEIIPTPYSTHTYTQTTCLQHVVLLKFSTLKCACIST